ncbi:MAG: hypothetical protein HXK98_03515 [Candidatus Nanogingivalaceae bacterium]|nr:hypothetical protein [Candidatus Nanogingivalaceae bacterium]
MKVVNLTPHEVTVYDDDDVVIKSYPSEGVARARQTNVVVGCFDGTPVVKTEFGEVTGLPEPAERTVYVVSFITANAAKAHGRTTDDLLVTSGPVRDDKGRVIGCRAFARI